VSGDNDCVYCIDASVFIDLKHYPSHIFEVWSAFDHLAAAGRLITFRGIADECHDSACIEWFKRHTGIVKPFSTELNDCILRVLSDLDKMGKRMFNPSAEKDERDPFLVALALAESERAGKPPSEKGLCCDAGSPWRR
jgi:hypothetical protein